MNLEVKIPVEIQAEDYHEFEDLQRHFKKLNRKIKVREVGFKEPNYVGLVYIDPKDFREAKRSWENKQ